MKIFKSTYQNITNLLVLTVIEIGFYMGGENFSMHVAATTLFTFLIILFPQRDFIFNSVLFMLPNQRLFTIPGTNISLINIFIVFILLRHFNIILKTNKKFLGISCIVMVYTLTISILHKDTMLAVHAIKLVNVFWVCYYIVTRNGELSHRIYDNLIVYFVCGVLAAGILGFLLDPNYTAQTMGTKIRFAGGEFNNPNILSFDISFAIALGLTHLIYYKNNILIFTLAIAVLTIVGLLTQSKSFYLIALLMFGIFFICGYSIVNRRNIIFVITALFLIAITIYFTKNEIFEIFNTGMDRIVNPKNDDISSQRFTLWRDYTTFLIDHPFYLWLGGGMKDLMSAMNTFNVAHNGALEVIVPYGVVGFLLFIIYFVMSSAVMSRVPTTMGTPHSERLFRYMPLMVLLITSVTGHAFIANPFVIKYFISIMVINYFKKPTTIAQIHARSTE